MDSQNSRAVKGGQQGVNGEWYDGGQFLPSSPETVKGMMKSNVKPRTRKEQVAPYVWETLPAENLRSIYTLIAGVFAKVVNGEMILVANPLTYDYYKTSPGRIQKLCDLWNNGERWIEHTPNPF